MAGIAAGMCGPHLSFVHQEGSASGAPSWHQRLQLARLLQQALPRLTDVLRWALTALGSQPTAPGGDTSINWSHVCSICPTFGNSLWALDELCPLPTPHTPLATTLEALAVHCSCAAAALQALPSVADTVSCLQQLTQVRRISAAKSKPALALADSIDKFVLSAGYACRTTASSVGSGILAQQQPVDSLPLAVTITAAAADVWQLHSATCRLVNWLPSQEGRCSELLPGLHAPAAQLALLTHAITVFKQLLLLHQRSQQAAGTLGPGPSSRSEAGNSHIILSRWACSF